MNDLHWTPKRIEVLGWDAAGRFQIVPVVGGYKLVDFRTLSAARDGFWQAIYPTLEEAQSAAAARAREKL
jgi:hypothetical protein